MKVIHPLLLGLAVSLVLAGCGRGDGIGQKADRDDHASHVVIGQAASTQDEGLEVAPAVVEGSVPEADEAADVLAASKEPGVAETPTDTSALPPDIAVMPPDTLVRPGESVELVVQATPDVEEVILWDGVGDRQALVYDQEAQAWRVTYRVPLRVPWERLGISLTARNGAERWRRVWVFLNVGQGAPAAREDLAGASGDTGLTEP